MKASTKTIIFNTSLTDTLRRCYAIVTEEYLFANEADCTKTQDAVTRFAVNTAYGACKIVRRFFSIRNRIISLTAEFLIYLLISRTAWILLGLWNRIPVIRNHRFYWLYDGIKRNENDLEVF